MGPGAFDHLAVRSEDDLTRPESRRLGDGHGGVPGPGVVVASSRGHQESAGAVGRGPHGPSPPVAVQVVKALTATTPVVSRIPVMRRIQPGAGRIVWTHDILSRGRGMTAGARQRATWLGVAAVILDADRRLLLVHRTQADLWTLPGGDVHFGEHPEDALRRTLAEETSLIAVRARLAGTYDDVHGGPDGAGRHRVRLLYLVRSAGEPRVPHGVAIDGVERCTLDDLPERVTPWVAEAARIAAEG